MRIQKCLSTSTVQLLLKIMCYEIFEKSLVTSVPKRKKMTLAPILRIMNKLHISKKMLKSTSINFVVHCSNIPFPH